ncbi:MAG: cell division protein SepF [Clostridia bacterium]|nr:cell division protein SepF [Clostridia bacterium]
MGILDKLKHWARVTDSEYFPDPEETGYDDYDDDYIYDEPAAEEAPEEATVEPAAHRHVSYQPSEHSGGRVVDIHSAPRSQVVFKKLDKFEDAGAVADVLNEKKIVILNLETCPNDVSRRVLDFLYGVAYANNGEIKRVAGRAYIITPYNVPVSGEMLDEIESSSATL